MVVAYKAKRNLTLHMFHSKESTFMYTQELLLPDAPKSVCWAGKNICVGFKREYVLVFPDGSQPKPLFSGGQNQQTTVEATLPDEVILTRESNCHFFCYLYA